MKKLGAAALDSLVEQLRPFRYVNTMIDAATVLRKYYVHVTLSNPYSVLASLPLNKILKMWPADWYMEDYLSALQHELARVTSIGSLVVVSVCHDRLSAHAQAVCQHRYSMKDRSNSLNESVEDMEIERFSYV